MGRPAAGLIRIEAGRPKGACRYQLHNLVHREQHPEHRGGHSEHASEDGAGLGRDPRSDLPVQQVLDVGAEAVELGFRPDL